jgi:uncharacterized protein (DUF779 family)
MIISSDRPRGDHGEAGRLRQVSPGDHDVLLGTIGADTPVYIGAAQHEAWEHTALILDVVPGRSGTFSLDNRRERRFLTRSTVCTVADREPMTRPGLAGPRHRLT